MSLIEINCKWCEVRFERHACHVKRNKFNFCSRDCQNAFRTKKLNPAVSEVYDFSGMSKNMTRLNRELNPGRMTPEVRAKLRAARLGSGEGKTYTKTYGRHTHRIVAESMLGRPLREGEVVHHKNKNKRDNRPSNLQVFSSQAEHAAWHAEELRQVGRR